ncbi:hypothetical protein [Calothrix sp. CCY 0018]|uniref:hypothetical protein n=1 Tax=Calothrix sp. CCY 0018 TaxID=3103864 RepID=UPI0039C6E913
MKKTFHKLLEVRNVVSRELKKLPKSSESERCILNVILEYTEMMIRMTENME